MMRRALIPFIILTVLLALAGATSVGADELVRKGLIPGQVQTDTGRIIVKFKPSVAPNERAALHGSFNAAVIAEVPRLSMQVVHVPNARATEAIAAAYSSHPLVAFAEPDALVPLAHTGSEMKTPNDTYYGLQWQHANIDSAEAWHHSTGDSSRRITVCDTGVNANHPDLVANVNTALGWNAVDGSNNFWPIHWHGTAVAGSAAATGDNGIGVTGVAWAAEIIPVRISNLTTGGAYFSDMVKCIDYGTLHDSTVINLSYQTYSGFGRNKSLSNAIIDAGNAAFDNGSLLVVAAGNENTDPSGGKDPAKIVYAAATDSADNKASFSNYGNYVDVATPGVDIVTTYSECGTSSCGDYAYVSGTSFSSPLTAGAILLVKSANPTYGPGQLISALTNCAKNIGSATYFGAGLLNAHGSVHGTTCTSSAPPPEDTTPPAVTGVSSSAANAAYTVGLVIPITVTFDEPVNVTGTPRLTMETGASDAVVNYASGTGSSTLTFNYTVASGHVSADLDYVSSSALALNGGTIEDAAANDAVLTLPTPGTAGSLGANKAIVVDTLAPNDPTDLSGSMSGSTIVMTWTAATDNGSSGVDGYAYDFNTSSSPNCGTKTKELEETATGVTSASLAAGDYWFHICTRDNAGNWTSTASAGPFTIAASPPPAGVSVTGISPVSTQDCSCSISVTVSGSGFAPGASLTFSGGSGPTPTASGVVVAADGNSLTATVTLKPGGPPRPRVWDVSVTVGSSTGVLDDGFTVMP